MWYTHKKEDLYRLQMENDLLKREVNYLKSIKAKSSNNLERFNSLIEMELHFKNILRKMAMPPFRWLFKHHKPFLELEKRYLNNGK